jgi:hypothetical protein
MPPWWKIRRELVRPFRQALQIPELFFVKAASTRFYDCFLAKRKKITTGHQPVEERVAIFAMYSPTGLTEDHLHSLRYLKDCGYATIIVSNSPIEERQRQSHQDLFHVLIERANYGYDFGAYRDGFLFLNENINLLSHLVFLNDSCIFPLSFDKPFNWFSRAEHSGYNFYAVSVNNLRKASDGEISRRFHYGSYAFMLDSVVAKSSEFRCFWLNLNLAFSKNLIVREGEIALSKFLVRSRFSHSCLLQTQHVIDVLSNKIPPISYEELSEYLLDGPDEKFKEKFLSEPIYQINVKQLISRIIYGKGGTYHLAPLLIPIFKVNFFKKKLLNSPRGEEVYRQTIKVIGEFKYPNQSIDD